METSPEVVTASPKAFGSCDELAERVRDETLSALKTAGIIRDAECEGFKNYLISNSINTGEILPVMAQLRGIVENEHAASVANWARAIAPIVKKRYPLVPFADKLLGSASLIEEYGTILSAASATKCPLIYAEDTDVIGFGTLNPVAGNLLSDFVSQYLNSQVGTTPYLSIFLLDLRTWESICSRQFEQ